jgi:hypothetical protein
MRKIEIKALGNEDNTYGKLAFFYKSPSVSIPDKKEHGHHTNSCGISAVFLINNGPLTPKLGVSGPVSCDRVMIFCSFSGSQVLTCSV